MANAPTSLGSFSLPPTLPSTYLVTNKYYEEIKVSTSCFYLNQQILSWNKIKVLLSTCRPPKGQGNLKEPAD